MSTLVIIVVTAAVAVGVGMGLYFGLVHTQSTPPAPSAEITFTPAPSSPVGATFFDNFSLSVRGNLSTSVFGFQLVNSVGTSLSAGSAIGRCVGPSVSTCTGSSLGWYVVLTDANGRILATYDSEYWTAPIAVASGDHAVLIADYPLVGSSSHFSAVPTGSLAVTGSVLL